MWCLQVTPRCIDMAQETEWMNEWSPKAWSWQLKNHHYNKLKFGETERECCVYRSTEVFVPRYMNDLAQWSQINNTRKKIRRLNLFYPYSFTLLKFDSVEIKIFIASEKNYSTVKLYVTNIILSQHYIILQCIFINITYAWMGTVVAQCLRCCASNWKVASSIPDGVIGVFHWHNPTVRTMSLGWT